MDDGSQRWRELFEMRDVVSDVRCVTMNVLSYSNPDWDCRRLVLADQFRALDADVVALQEVRLPDAMEILGPGFHLTSFSATGDDGVGGVLATRSPHRMLEEIEQRSERNGRDLPWCATMIVEAE